MLVVSGIILTCLSGLLLTGIIGTRFSWTERIGLSFPLGMTLQTVVMALLDLMHIPLTSFSVLSAGAVTFALLMFIVARYRGFESFRITSAMLDDWKQANLVWVLLIILIGYCEYMNFSKCMFFPSQRPGQPRGIRHLRFRGGTRPHVYAHELVRCRLQSLDTPRRR